MDGNDTSCKICAILQSTLARFVVDHSYGLWSMGE